MVLVRGGFELWAESTWNKIRGRDLVYASYIRADTTTGASPTRKYGLQDSGRIFQIYDTDYNSTAHSWGANRITGSKAFRLVESCENALLFTSLHGVSNIFNKAGRFRGGMKFSDFDYRFQTPRALEITEESNSEVIFRFLHTDAMYSLIENCFIYVSAIEGYVWARFRKIQKGLWKLVEVWMK